MRIFGLIGYPLSHSFSQKYFNDKFQNEGITDSDYKLFPLKNIYDLRSLLTSELIGLNVTIPYKEKIIQFLDDIDPIADEVGAVNTIKIKYESGKYILKGYNTDVYGFEQSIKPLLNIHHQKALILGTGGASKAVYYVLKNIGIECLFVSRNPQMNNSISYETLNKTVIESFKLIINTTPLGMYPNIKEVPPIPYEFLSENHFLYDLIYNPKETLFLHEGKKAGAIIQNGLNMLYFQAEKAWEIWNEES
ncbi:MAG: shikimate dehydrogenase [Bacteroidota bacterium]|nr:shikimate dehydrogenase [Bacteroidota bacterium]